MTEPITEPITLYLDTEWVSPYALTALVSLEEKGLSYDVEEISLRDGAHRTYGALTGRVPALRHGEHLLSESLAIAEYLAEMFPWPKAPMKLFPADFRERSRAREIMMWLRSDLHAIREERHTHGLFYDLPRDPLSPAAEAAVARLLAACDVWISEERATLFAEWCIADPDLALMLQRLLSAGHPLPSKVEAYARANFERPSVKLFCEHARPPFEPPVE